MQSNAYPSPDDKLNDQMISRLMASQENIKSRQGAKGLF